MTLASVGKHIAAAPARVWAAFTSPDEYAAWIWPAEWNTTCEIDLRVGGGFRVSSEARGLSIQGRYVEIDPITRLDRLPQPPSRYLGAAVPAAPRAP